MDSKIRKKFVDVVTYIGVYLILIVTVSPVAWLVLTSFKKPVDIYAMPPKIIFSPTLENYKTLIFERDFINYFKNSVLIAVSTTLICVFLGTLFAYALSRFSFRRRDDLAFWVLSLRMMPPIAVILPYYLLFMNLKLLDTHLALIIVYFVINFPFAVWMMKGFFKELPIEYEEAALVDGCTRLQVFIRIVMPLIRPGLAATAVFAFIFSWNEFLFALILTGERVKTLPVGVTGFITFEGVKWGLLAAGGIFIIAPVLILSLLIQRHLVKGLSFGGIK